MPTSLKSQLGSGNNPYPFDYPLPRKYDHPLDNILSPSILGNTNGTTYTVINPLNEDQVIKKAGTTYTCYSKATLNVLWVFDPSTITANVVAGNDAPPFFLNHNGNINVYFLCIDTSNNNYRIAVVNTADGTGVIGNAFGTAIPPEIREFNGDLFLIISSTKFNTVSTGIDKDTGNRLTSTTNDNRFTGINVGSYRTKDGKILLDNLGMYGRFSAGGYGAPATYLDYGNKTLLLKYSSTGVFSDEEYTLSTVLPNGLPIPSLVLATGDVRTNYNLRHISADTMVNWKIGTPEVTHKYWDIVDFDNWLLKVLEHHTGIIG